MMIHLLNSGSRGGHEPERVNEIRELVFPMQLAVLHAPSGQLLHPRGHVGFLQLRHRLDSYTSSPTARINAPGFRDNAQRDSNPAISILNRYRGCFYPECFPTMLPRLRTNLDFMPSPVPDKRA